MTISIEKGLIGREDISFDNVGSSSTFPRKTSNGSFKEFTKINASHIPLTTTARAKTMADNSTTPGNDVDAAVQAIATSLTSIGVPDNSTLQNDSGTLKVKALGVGTAQLAADCVTGAKVADDQIDSEHYVAGSIDTEHLNQTNGAEAVTQACIRAGAVDSTELADSAVTTAKVADDTVNIDKMDMDGSGTAPVLFPVLTGTHSLAGGAAAEAENITGLLATDNVIAIVQSTTNTVGLRSVVASAGSVTYTFTADPGVSSVDYIVFRATST